MQALDDLFKAGAGRSVDRVRAAYSRLADADPRLAQSLAAAAGGGR